MINDNALTGLAGKTVHGQDGQKIGKIVDVYESTDGSDGTFVTVSTGLFGGHASFVPLREAELRGDDVVVPYDKALVKDAPRVAADEELTSEEEDRLYRHYSLAGAGTTTHGTTTGTTTTGTTAGTTAGATAAAVGTAATTGTRSDEHRTVGHDTSGPTTDDAMTRSEERLQVGTQRVEAGRARLRKRIVTETETVTVPVARETVHVERETITDGNVAAAYAGPALSEEEHEVVLHREEPVVAKETVPVERVRLDTDVVTSTETVAEQVRKEVIETEGVETGGVEVDERPRR